MSQSELNLKYLKDIQDYKNAHTNDYKQVYFSPASVKSSRVQNAVPMTKPMKTIGGNQNAQTCASNAAQEGVQYYALSPSSNGEFSCELYSSDQIKDTSTKPVIVKTVWQMELPASTSYVCLDMIGNLNAYDAKHQVLKTLLKSQDKTDKRSKAGRFKLVLLDNADNYLQPIRIQNAVTGAAFASVTVQPPLNLTTNEEWKQENNMVRSLSNKDQQVENKRISIDKITPTQSLVSNDYKYKLSINEMALVLQASTKDTRQIYKTNADDKVGKLYYAGTYPEHQFLKEVPGSMQTLQPGNYSTYQEVYPVTKDRIESENCTKVCDDDAGCQAVYTVVDSVSKKTYCFVSKDMPAFYAKPSQSTMDSSILQVKNPAINKPEYANASYVADGYNSEFSTYTPSGPINASFVPGPDGAPYIQELQKKVVSSTIGTKESFVADDALRKIDNIKSSVNKYISTQSDLSNNRAIITNKLSNINTVYTDMSNDNNLYDFTTKDTNGKPITHLIGKEDHSLENALEQDNLVYTNEQQNLYTIATLTMATLLVMAIII